MKSCWVEYTAKSGLTDKSLFILDGVRRITACATYSWSFKENLSVGTNPGRNGCFQQGKCTRKRP